MPSVPTVDVVIAVHDPSRPLARAISSVLQDRVDGVRVIVVCHGRPADDFSDTRDAFAASPVQWLEFADGVRSPTGPFMYGLRGATADYVTIMGSDDFLQPEAVATALARISADRPDALILPLQHQSGEVLRNPLARKRRVHALDPVRDRLAYRTAPLAYIRRGVLEELQLELTPDVPAGNDIEFSAKLWYSGARVDFHPADPGYVIGADADTRVTTTPRPARVELTALRLLLTRDWLLTASARARTSLMIKILRIHVLGPMLRRAAEGALSDEDLDEYSQTVRTVLTLAPRSLRPFCRADRDILDALAASGITHPRIRAAVVRHPTAGLLARLVPRNPLAAADREGSLRRFLRYRSWP